MARFLNLVLSRATSSAHGQVVRTRSAKHGQRPLSDVGREILQAAPRPNSSGDRVNRFIAASAFFIGATWFFFEFLMEARR